MRERYGPKSAERIAELFEDFYETLADFSSLKGIFLGVPLLSSLSPAERAEKGLSPLPVLEEIPALEDQPPGSLRFWASPKQIFVALHRPPTASNRARRFVDLKSVASLP
jgi:hypothetical protein